MAVIGNLMCRRVCVYNFISNMCISVSSETVVESKQKIQIRIGASSTLAPSVQ